MSYTWPGWDAADFTWENARPYTWPDFDAADLAIGGDIIQAALLGPGILGAPSATVTTPPCATVQGAGILGVPSVTAINGIRAVTQGVGLLGTPAVKAICPNAKTLVVGQVAHPDPTQLSVALYDWDTHVLAYVVHPDAMGFWRAEVLLGSYGITYQADGYAPLTHGPYSF